MNCGNPFKLGRYILKVNTRVTAKMMKAKFGLSDPNDPDFQQYCAHQHTHSSPKCNDITSCLEKVHQIIKYSNTLSFYSSEQEDDLLYDIKKASDAINEWKAHIQEGVDLHIFDRVRMLKPP